MPDLTPSQPDDEPVPDKVVEGVRVFVHRYEPTDEDRANWDAWWQKVIGRLLNESVPPVPQR